MNEYTNNPIVETNNPYQAPKSSMGEHEPSGNKNTDDSVGAGIFLLMAAHFMCVLPCWLFGLIGVVYPYFMYLGMTQLPIVCLLVWWLGKEGRTQSQFGVWIGAAIVVLVNAPWLGGLL